MFIIITIYKEIFSFLLSPTNQERSKVRKKRTLNFAAMSFQIISCQDINLIYKLNYLSRDLQIVGVASLAKAVLLT